MHCFCLSFGKTSITSNAFLLYKCIVYHLLNINTKILIFCMQIMLSNCSSALFTISQKIHEIKIFILQANNYLFYCIAFIVYHLLHHKEWLVYDCFSKYYLVCRRSRPHARTWAPARTRSCWRFSCGAPSSAPRGWRRVGWSCGIRHRLPSRSTPEKESRSWVTPGSRWCAPESADRRIRSPRPRSHPDSRPSPSPWVTADPERRAAPPDGPRPWAPARGSRRTVRCCSLPSRDPWCQGETTG